MNKGILHEIRLGKVALGWTETTSLTSVTTIDERIKELADVGSYDNK